MMRWWSVVALLANLLLPADGQLISVDDKDPYRNLVVKVGLDVEDCSILLANVEEILQKASTVLRDATQNRLAFLKVTIVVPETLALSCNLPSETPAVVRMPEVHLTLGMDHPVFGREAWTLQSQGCGRPGHRLYLPYTFLRNGSSVMLRGRRVVHEWAKYRWGVFEEYGLEGDPVFPLQYSTTAAYPNTTNGWLPNYCANADLNGRFKEPCYTPDCSFEFEEEQNATSSLLALPNLGSVLEFCDASTHQELTPTKHNAQCAGRSVWHVLQDHQDFQRSSVPVVADGDEYDLQMTYVRYDPEAAGSYVLLVEQTSYMSNSQRKERWDLVRSSVKQWVMEDLLTNSILGVATFTSSVSLRKPMTVVNATSRPALADSLPSSPSYSSSKNIVNALNYVKSQMLPSGGTVILVVYPYNFQNSAQDMVNAAGPCAVWPVLFPFTTTTSQTYINRFRTLANATGGRVLKVFDSTFSMNGVYHQSLKVQQALTHHFRTVQAHTIRYTSLIPKIQVSQEQLVCDLCSFDLFLADNVDLAHPVTLFFYTHLTPSYVIANGGPPLVLQNVTEKVFKVSPDLTAGHNKINVKFFLNLEPHLMEVMARPEEEEDLQVELWSSHDLSFLQLDQPQDPVSLHVRVSKSERPVLGAEVRVTLEADGSSFDLKLKDSGGGSPDITGGDGVYSRYWVFVPSGVNSYTLVVQVLATPWSRVVGYTTSTADTGVSCCGSALRLDQLPAENFVSDIVYVAGEAVVVSEPGQLDLFPPARITDLSADLAGDKVTLSFTAPGDDLDYGYALEYRVYWATRSLSWEVVEETTYSVVEGGSVAQMEVVPPLYDHLVYYQVRGRDTLLQEGGVSNTAALTVYSGDTTTSPPPTEPPSVPCPSHAGAICGAFFGGLFTGVLMAVLGYFLKRKYYKGYKAPAPRPEIGLPSAGHTNTAFSGDPPSKQTHSLPSFNTPGLRGKSQMQGVSNAGKGGRKLPVEPSNDATPSNMDSEDFDNGDEGLYEELYEVPQKIASTSMSPEPAYVDTSIGFAGQ